MLSHQDHVVDYVDDFLHGVLVPKDAAYVQEHCKDCKVCGPALEEARRRYELTTSVPPLEASDELIEKTISDVDRRAGRRQRTRKYVTHTLFWATAASVLIIAGVQFYFYQLTPTPYDLHLLGNDRFLAGSAASVRVALFDRTDLQGAADVPVEIELIDRQKGQRVTLASFRTGAQGSASPALTIPDWPDGKYLISVRADTPSGDEVLTQQIRLERSSKVMLSTDKPVYQPGQTIRLRSLALRRPDLKPISDQKTEFSITDPAGNVIFRRSEATSRFGIASADCPLATEIIEGAYQIDCRVGDTTSSRTVEVQKYVLPKFKIDIELDKPYYAPGRLVKGDIEARYFFGKPVVDGQATIQAFSSDAGSNELYNTDAKSDG